MNFRPQGAWNRRSRCIVLLDARGQSALSRVRQLLRSITKRKGNILNDLLQLAHVETLLDETTERGFLEERELEAFALEHDLQGEDLDELRRALEERDVELRVETEDA